MTAKLNAATLIIEIPLSINAEKLCAFINNFYNRNVLVAQLVQLDGVHEGRGLSLSCGRGHLAINAAKLLADIEDFTAYPVMSAT